MNKPYKTGIVHLWDLPENIILVGLKENYKISMLKDIKRNSKKLTTFFKEIGLNLYTYYNFKHNQKVRLNFLCKISESLIKEGFKKYSKEEIEKNIKLIGTKRGTTYIFNPKLPFNFNSKEGAYFISSILFDGGIDRQYKPHYGNIYSSMRKRIVKSAKKIFGKLKNKESNPKRNNYFVRFPKTMGIVLNHCFKIGIGNKMYNNNKIPKFIFNFPNDIKCCFLKQAFDDDGNISQNKRTIKLIGVSDVKKDQFRLNNTTDYHLLNDIKKLLSDIGIESNRIRISNKVHLTKEYNKKGHFFRHTFYFSITGRKNIEKFYHKVGFNLDYKMKRLKNLLNKYKQWQLRKGEIKKIALKKASFLEDKNGYFDNIMLAKKINRQYRQTVRITRELLKERKIKIKENAIPTGKGWIATKFILNNNKPV